MKLKDKEAFRASKLEELRNLLGKMRDELFLFKLDKTQNKLKNTRSLFLKRKEIALISTLIREKELQEEMEAKNEKTSK